MMKPCIARIFLACLVGSCSMLSGCGDSSLGRVSGVVTMDGLPLANAQVLFAPTAGGLPAIGKTNDQGKYQLYRRGEKGIPVGTYKVVVTTLRISDMPAERPEIPATKEARLKELKEQMMLKESLKESARTKEPIPANYNKSTILKEKVAQGSNTIDLKLQSSESS